MRYLLLTYFIFFLGVHAFCQDIIYKKDGSRIEAKLISIGDENIKYKKLSNLNGPDYILSIRDIKLIEFEAGGHTIFNNKSEKSIPVVREKKTRVNPYDNNSASFNYFDLLLGSVSVAFERFSKDGMVSVRIPLGLGYSDTQELNGETVLYKGGLDINIYPTGQGRVRYFLGPGIRIRRESYPETIGVDSSGNPVLIETKFSTLGTYVNNGALFQVTDNFNFGLLIAVGIKQVRSSVDITDISNEEHTFVEGSFGIRF